MEPEFNLSVKRKELRWQIDKRKEKRAMSLLLDAVEKQDEEFIKKLKKELCFCHKVGDYSCMNCNIIDKCVKEVQDE